MAGMRLIALTGVYDQWTNDVSSGRPSYTGPLTDQQTSHLLEYILFYLRVLLFSEEMVTVILPPSLWFSAFPYFPRLRYTVLQRIKKKKI